MILIALALSGKGSWSKVFRLVKEELFTKVIILTNDFGKDKIVPIDKMKVLQINNEANVKELKSEIFQLLKKEIDDVEVAINIDSGIGKEHTALICALLEVGIGIRFFSVEQEEVVEL